MRDRAMAVWAGVALILLGYVLLRPRGVAVEVVAMDWRRVIEVEREVPEMHATPCSEMPAGAELLERLVRDGAAHCRYRAPVWRMRRHVVAEGLHPSAPHWPDPQLQPGERAGRRHESQQLQLADRDGRRWDCRLSLPEWQTWRPGEPARLTVHRFSGVADCAGLTR